MLLIVSLISLVMIGINADIYDEVKHSRNFTDKVVLVTGSSQGIGEATVKLFASLGAKVVVTGRNATLIKSVAEEAMKLSPFGLKPLEVIADLSKDEDIEMLFNETIKKFGKLDVLVNNAGISGQSTINSPDLMARYESVFQIDLRAPLYLTHLAIPYLEKSKGTVINISSGLALHPAAYAIVYSMSKASLDMMTKVLAVELGSAGVRVNTINPGVVDTNFGSGPAGRDYEALLERTPLKRVGQPIDIAKGIVFLASTDAQFITGANLIITGGSHLTA